VAEIVVGTFLAGVALLAAGGIAKVRDPAATFPALGALRLPGTPAAARALGLVEIGVAALGVLRFGRGTALAVGALYAALAIGAARLTRSPDVGCGCLGSRGAPASAMHVVIDAAFACAAVLVALDAPQSVRSLTDGSGSVMRMVWLVVLAALTARLAHLTMNELPRSWGAADERPAP
jgi:hypothetical protein